MLFKVLDITHLRRFFLLQSRSVSVQLAYVLIELLMLKNNNCFQLIFFIFKYHCAIYVQSSLTP